MATIFLPVAYYNNPNAKIIMSTTLFMFGIYCFGLYFLMFYYKETREKALKENLELKKEIEALKQ